MDYTASTSSGAAVGRANNGVGPRGVSTLLRLVGLMGREAFSKWTEHVKARNGCPPNDNEVEDMIAISAAYGEEEFRSRIQEEYCGGAGGEEEVVVTGFVPAAAPVAVGVTAEEQPVRVGFKNQ